MVAVTARRHGLRLATIFSQQRAQRSRFVFAKAGNRDAFRSRYCSSIPSTEDKVGPSPLFLWLGGAEQLSGSSEPSGGSKKLLLPVTAPEEPTVLSSRDVLDLVNTHYEAESQFVGGMGESDPGVWFATTAAAAKQDRDTLDFCELIQESIALVKQERHGVPFGVYTTGVCPGLSVPVGELGLRSCQVSLFAGSPPEYMAATGYDNGSSLFNQVCGFIATATEEGIPVEVGLLEKYTSTGRDLAFSLGAQNVHIYQK